MPVESTWETRDLRVLEAIHDCEEDGRSFGSDAVATKLRLTSGAVHRSYVALIDGKYAQPARFMASIGGVIVESPRLAERGRRTLGQWPSDGYGAFVSVIEARIENEQDPQERSKLERLRDGVVDVGRDVATDVIAAVIKSQVPGI